MHKGGYDYSFGIMPWFFFPDVNLDDAIVERKFMTEDAPNFMEKGYHVAILKGLQIKVAFFVLEKNWEHSRNAVSSPRFL